MQLCFKLRILRGFNISKQPKLNVVAGLELFHPAFERISPPDLDGTQARFSIGQKVNRQDLFFPKLFGS